MIKLIYNLIIWMLIFCLLSACGIVWLGDANNPVDIEYALENIKDYYGKDVYIKGYPVAYYELYSFTGLIIQVYFSDNPSEYIGKIDSLSDVQENWIHARTYENEALWQYTDRIFTGDSKPELLILVFRAYKDKTFGDYYEFVDYYKAN